MPEDIEIMSYPWPCAICGRPTTQLSRRLGVPYCGRDEDPAEADGEQGEQPLQYGAAMRGHRRGWWRRG